MSFKSSLTTPTVAAIGFCLIGGTSPAHADLGDQLFKLLADDGHWDDWVGKSVGISGTTAIAGAHGGDDACKDYDDCNSGAAYLFDVDTGQQLFKLLADDTTSGDHFGEAVAISSTIAIAGAHSDDDNGNLSGSAYLFDITTGQQLFKLLPNDGEAFDQFGRTVAVGGTTAIVGAPGSDLLYLYDITDPESPIEVAKLQDPDDPDSGFGSSIAISPDGFRAIVGAIADDDNGPAAGAAYLFDISDPKNPVLLFKLLADDGTAGNWFGHSVAISGNTAIVGASFDEDNGQWSGSAYLFDITTGQQLFKLLPDDGEAFDRFGMSVGINDSIGVVGAPADGDNGVESGSAYLFDISTGQQLVKLLADDKADEDWFGGSVAISGVPGNETAIVGAPAPSDTGVPGSAYLFDAASAPPCPWDLDASGSVGASDLLALLASWGPCKGCPADFNGDGSVGASDLLALLANWGPCP